MNVHLCANWLIRHGQQVLGVTSVPGLEELDGVCVVSEYSTPDGGFSCTVWVPANREAMLEYMNY